MTDPIPPAKVPRALVLARVGLVALVVVGLLLAWRFGVLAQVTEPRELARSVVAAGAWGYLGFVVAYTLLQPFGVPGTVFVFAAPLLWPWPTAFALSMAGTMGASVVGFAFARFVARDWLSPRIPARLRRYDDALARNAFGTVFVLRLVLWMPQVLHAFFGVSKVSGRTHFWGSLFGYVPPLFVLSWLGSELFDEAGHLQAKAWPVMGAFTVVSLGVWLAWRRWEKRTRVSASP